LDSQELLAWGGALEGIADRLRTQRAQIPEKTELWRVVDGVVRRLDTEYRASEASVLVSSTAK
jgi:hypothetical protein